MITYYRNNFRADPLSSTPYFGLNEYFRRRLDAQRVLVTARHGGWVILSNEEYAVLQKNKLQKDSLLFKDLERVGIVLTGESLKNTLRDLNTRYGFLFTRPSFHVISLTDQCDLKCLYCHPAAGPGREEMSEETVKRVLDFIFSNPARFLNIQVTGGEPLMRWPMVKFVYEQTKERAAAKGVNFRFLLSTNLTLLTDEMAQEISQMDINISSSLDGPKELHDKQRPYVSGSGSYDKTVYWIKRLEENFKMRVGLLPVVTAFSLAAGPEVIIDEYVRLNQRSVSLKPLRMSGRAWENVDQLGITSADFYRFWERGVEYCLSLNKKGISVKESNASFLLRNMLSPSDPGSMCHRRPCGAGITMLAYKWDGTITACDAARDTNFLDMGNVVDNTYETIKSKILPLVGICSDVIPICASCPFAAYCNTCRVDTWSREGDLYPKPPRSFDCRWHQKAFEFLFQKFSNKEEAQILQSWSR